MSKAPKMREFYITYREQPKMQPLVAQIGWTHNLIVLQRCEDTLEREFYIRCGVCLARRRQTHRCGYLPHGEAAAQGTQRSVALSGRDCKTAGGRGMSLWNGERGIYVELEDLNAEAGKSSKRISRSWEFEWNN